MEKKAFFIRGLDEETIRTIKVISANSGKTIGQTVKRIVNHYVMTQNQNKERK